MSKGVRRQASARARLNLQLPPELFEELSRRAEQLQMTIPELARRLLCRGLEELEREELDRRLIEGYQALAEENARLLREFSAVDREGWDLE